VASINSIAHFFGERPYDEKLMPAENAFCNLISLGEGGHNWHHKYPFDYAGSEFDIFERFNPTKFFIDLLASMGHVTDRKSAKTAWAIAKQRRNEKENEATSGGATAGLVMGK